VFDRARAGDVDLIIMDVSLSNSEMDGVPVDGLEISRRLKRDPLAGRIPILLATAHAMKGSRESFLRSSGADDYISKPIVSADDLIARIQALIEKRENALPRPPG
jgi:two-component system, cell cycle response regulator DivK